MTFVAVQGVHMPGFFPLGNIPTLSTAAVIDATGEKVAMIGRVWNKDRATKSIDKVGFRFGAITKAGGSGLTVSLQDVDLANGPPFQPDGTQDQTVAIANGNASFASNTWITTGSLNAQRSVAFGELLAVVVEYDGSGRLGADSVVVSVPQGVGLNGMQMHSGVSLLTASWVALAIHHATNVILEFSDGTFGTLDHGFPHSAWTSAVLRSDTSPDEAALKFRVPVPMKVDGGWFSVVSVAASGTYDLVLYEGTTALQTVSVDPQTIISTAAGRFLEVTFPETTLNAGTDYYWALKATNTVANNVQYSYFDVATANHLQAHPGGPDWHFAGRTDGGAWTPTTTRRPVAGLRISALHDGAGSGGGGNKWFG